MTHLIETWGALAVFVLSVAQSLGVPTSSELTFGLVGLLWAVGSMNPIEGILAGILGETLGAVVAWWLARSAVESAWWARFERHPLVHAFRDVLSSLLGRRFGVLVSRLIPLERNIAAWAAGVAEVPATPLVLQSALGTAIFATAFVLAGYAARSAITQIAHRAGQIGEVLAVVIAVGVLLAIRHLAHRQTALRAQRRRPPNESHTFASGLEDVSTPTEHLTLDDFAPAAYLGALGRVVQAAEIEGRSDTEGDDGPDGSGQRA